MTKLQTIFSSNIPVDCHIIKGRLQTEGITCFIYDEHIVWVNPFKAIAIGGVKLKVPTTEFEHAQKLLDLSTKEILIDELGEYELPEAFDKAIERQNEVLSIKHQIREDNKLLDHPDGIKSNLLNQMDLQKLLNEESEFRHLQNKKLNFSWKNCLAALFDFDQSIFKYFRVRTTDYHIEKEIVENFINQKESAQVIPCPECKSTNTARGLAIDYKWDFVYLFISLILFAPFFRFVGNIIASIVVMILGLKKEIQFLKPQ